MRNLFRLLLAIVALAAASCGGDSGTADQALNDVERVGEIDIDMPETTTTSAPSTTTTSTTTSAPGETDSSAGDTAETTTTAIVIVATTNPDAVAEDAAAPGAVVAEQIDFDSSDVVLWFWAPW